MDANALLNDAIAKATAKAVAEIEQQARNEASDRASQIEAWKQQQSEREKAERLSRNKSGMDIAEDFIKECSAPFTRLMSRDDAAKMASIKIVFRPGKSDASAGHSIQVECPGMSARTWHRASIDQMADYQKDRIEKLKTKGGFIQNSPIEMLDEIIKLRGYLARVGKVVQNVETEDASKVRDILAPLQLPVEE